MKDFIQIDNKAVKMIKEIGKSGFIVYTTLKQHMNQRTKACFPSQKKLSEITGYDARQIRRAIKSLRECGMISVQRRQKKANIYYLKNKGEWKKSVVEPERNLEPLSNRFLVPDSYYEERINETIDMSLVPKSVKCVRVDFEKDILNVVVERSYFCPNCFLVMTDLEDKRIDCPWCQEKVTYKEMVN